MILKVYVQEIIRKDENGKDLVSDLQNGGHLYVCGGTVMGSDVMEAVREQKSDWNLYIHFSSQAYVVLPMIQLSDVRCVRTTIVHNSSRLILHRTHCTCII